MNEEGYQLSLLAEYDVGEKWCGPKDIIINNRTVDSNGTAARKLIKKLFPDDCDIQLFDAVRNDTDFEFIKDLLGKGAQLNVTEDYYGVTPLHIAAAYNQNSEIIKALLGKEPGVINARTKLNGFTPLMSAIICKNSAHIVFTLLDAGTDLTIADNDGKTTFKYLQEHADWEDIKKTYNF
jgi:ankyrin repeat protein